MFRGRLLHFYNYPGGAGPPPPISGSRCSFWFAKSTIIAGVSSGCICVSTDCEKESVSRS